MRFSTSLFTLLCCIAIPSAHAEQMDIWDFGAGSHLPDGAQTLTTVYREADGLHIKTSEDGYIFWNTPFLHPVDILTLRVKTEKSVDAALLWHPKNADGQLTHFFRIQGRPGSQDINIVPGDEPAWDWTTDQLALGIPAGTNMIIEGIIVRRFSPWEKLSVALKSFWTFDTFRAYTINFMWGPLVAFNPVSHARLFDKLPPPSWSADRFFYGLILACAALGLAYNAYDRTRGKRIALVLIAGSFCAIWILFDIRMGAEVISYGIDDYKSYIKPPEDEKTFRTHRNLYTRIEKMLPIIKQYDHYVLIAFEPSPFYSNLRYMSYPSIPLHTDQDTTHVKLWVVVDRSDITVNAENHLVNGEGTPLTATGRILQTIDDKTFLFATP